MKPESGPVFSKRLGKSHILWFQDSNSYIIISNTVQQLLDCFFLAKDKSDFVQRATEVVKIDESLADVYYDELNDFLDDISLKNNDVHTHTEPNIIPKPKIERHYCFGKCSFSINYSSERLMELIHPNLSHAHSNNLHEPKAVFDIFESDGLLHMFKNQHYIGSYETHKFHFLQGKFAMELLTTLYGNTESDWLATFHATTVSNGKEAIMLIGDSGNGKSTFSALLMASGLDLLADDLTPMLAEDGHLYRFPSAISIKEGAFDSIGEHFEGFAALETHQSQSKHIKVKYLPPTISFESTKRDFGCRKLVLVKYDKDTSGCEINPCEPEKALQILIPDSWISPKKEHSQTFLNWLGNLEFYELHYSDNEIAVKKMMRLFDDNR